ncbi:MAG TPA: energy transducer TonB [Stellaceae bacterium]|nr:energy transducer TonB [Stellaceae bacterium]
MSATEARREPILGRRYPAAAGTPDDRLGPIAGARGGTPAFGPLGSFGLHLAVVLILLFHPPLSGRPAPELRPIPVALVILPPKPKPPPAPQAPPKPKPPPPGRLASVDMGPTSGQKTAPAPAPPAGAPPQLEATAMPIPPPPKLAAPDEESLAFRPPSARSKPHPRPAALEGRQAKYPGPSATKDEYLAYLAMLTRRHIGLLTPQLLAGRRGTTVIDVLVLDNGTVERMDIFRSSGYPDIDRKIEEIVRAVGRFPPLPQYVQGPSSDLKFFFPFPDGLRD